MDITIKFKSQDKVLHIFNGELYEATVLYIHRIENPGTASQRILYCISGGNTTFIKDENDLYSSLDDAKLRIFKKLM